MDSLMKFFHLASAIIWLGGMTTLLFALRPGAMAILDGPVRARLMAQVWRRFFAIVAACVIILLATGGSMYSAGLRAFKLASASGGLSAVPLGWHVMTALGFAMALVFGHIYFAGFRKFQRAVAAEQWPVAAAAANQVHKLVVLNFCLGWLAIAAVRLLP